MSEDFDWKTLDRNGVKQAALATGDWTGLDENNEYHISGDTALEAYNHIKQLYYMAVFDPRVSDEEVEALLKARLVALKIWRNNLAK